MAAKVLQKSVTGIGAFQGIQGQRRASQGIENTMMSVQYGQDEATENPSVEGINPGMRHQDSSRG